MRATLLTAGLCAAAIGAAPAVAAGTRALAPGGTMLGGEVRVAAGPDGRALVTGSNHRRGTPIIERGADGRWRVAKTITPREVYPEFAAWGPGGALTVIAYDQRRGRDRRILALRRAPGAKRFTSSTIARSRLVLVGGAAASPNGDIAAIVIVDLTREVLLTATRGGAFGPPRAVPDALAVGVGGGRVVVASIGRRGPIVRTGTIRGPLGRPQLIVSERPQWTALQAAVDGAGVATVAFVREVPTDPLHRTALVAARARPDGRFGEPAVVGRGGGPEGGAGFADVALAAAGTTTALAWQPNDASELNPGGRLGVAVARADGAFAPPTHPSAPALEGHADPFAPALAVGAAGDVVLAYLYGSAVHATHWPAAGTGFGPPTVVSTLGHGGAPAVAMLADGSPLVAFYDARGAVFATPRLDGPRPDPAVPEAQVEFAPGSAARLRAANAVAVRIGCSVDCVARVRATLLTKRGITIVYDGPGKVLREGATLTRSFRFDPAKGARRAGGGARVTATVTVESVSGVSSETVRRLELR